MSNSLAWVALILVFTAVLIVGQALIGSLWGRADKLGRINNRMRLLSSGMSREKVYSSLKAQAPTGGGANGSLWQALMARLANLTSRAGVTIGPVRLVLFAVAAAIAVWLICLGPILGAEANAAGMAVAALIGALVLAALILVGWLRGRQAARVRKIDEQLPPSLDVMTRALRAGHPVIATVQLAAREMPDPIGTEFGLIVDEVTFGADFRVALQNFAARTGSEDARYLTVAINIQTETGGNLAEILDSIARTMRTRSSLRKRVRALSSEGRMSAYILSALPAGLISFELLFNPRFYFDKFSDPIFWPTTGIVGLLYLLGWLMMHRIMNFRY